MHASEILIPWAWVTSYFWPEDLGGLGLHEKCLWSLLRVGGRSTWGCRFRPTTLNWGNEKANILNSRMDVVLRKKACNVGN
jgi:hypothetical protein